MDQHVTTGRAGEHQLQVLDVYIVDILAHIEALLRHTHSTQRVLLRLRSEAPPPGPITPPPAIAALRGHATELHRESGLLRQIIQDLQAGVEALERTGPHRNTAQSGQ